MEEFATFASLVAVATHLTSLVKFASVGDLRSVISGVIPMAALFVVLILGGEADATAHVVIPGLATHLGDLDVASLLLVAIAGGSAGSTLYNFRRAVDNHDTPAEPKLGIPS